MKNRSLVPGLITAVLCLFVTSTLAVIPPAWITVSRYWSDGCVYMWNSSTKELYRLYERQNWDDPNPSHCAFSPDGKRVAFIVKRDGANHGVMVVNNDGTGL
ncbi:MAG: hypothetical protein GF331_22525, partial [Chitinivibrionales bacterium]|nr:hypothetical protein [Chitinivibrionales bacterium]